MGPEIFFFWSFFFFLTDFKMQSSFLACRPHTLNSELDSAQAIGWLLAPV